MKKNKLIVFDIDGTLIHSEFQHQLAFVKAMHYFGITEVNQEWKEYLHHTDSFILKENFERNLNKPFHFPFISEFENKMTTEILKLQEVLQIDGAQKMLNNIEENSDYGVCFATGSVLKPAILKLNQAKIKHHSNLVVSSNKIYEREGIVMEAIERAKKHYNINSFKEIISFGDGIWDLKTAKNCNVHFVGIGEKNKKDFEKENCKVMMNDFKSFNLKEVEFGLGI